MSNLLKSGDVLQNTYRILRVIDQGGMGAIYMAENRQLFNEVCAVKEMLDHYSSPEERKEGLLLFEQEAKMLNALRHPNLPRVRAYFSENNRYYLVMDYIKGRTLESIIESTSDFIPETVVLRWCESLCRILKYLHSRRPPVIFRDLNPRNIMLEDGTGEIKLIDFGIARVFKAGKNSDTISLGSPGYCPIEQYGRGQTDSRSDIYTLGATLYHLLTRRIPVAAVERIKPTPVRLAPPRKINPRISANTEQAILKAMEINPDDRYPSIEAMRHALFSREASPKPSARPARAATGAVPSSKPAAPDKSRAQAKPPGAPRPSKRGSPRFAWAVLLFVVSMVVAQWVEGWQDRNSGRDALPRGARTLIVPGSADGRVNFMAGDRTDWWRLKMARAGTLAVVLTPRSGTDHIRLTLYARDGKKILKKGRAHLNRIEATLALDRPATVLAHVVAPRLWDSTRYAIDAVMMGGPPAVKAPNLLVGVHVSESPSSPAIPNYDTPEGAPLLEPGVKRRAQLTPSDGRSLTWWRVRAPASGLLVVILNGGGRSSSMAVDVFDAGRRVLPVIEERAGSGDIHGIYALEPGEYALKVAARDAASPLPYTILTEFTEDPEALSGEDRLPGGANPLPYQGSVRDSVSYGRGDRTDWWRLELPGTGSVSVDLIPGRSNTVRMRAYEAPAGGRFRVGHDGPPLETTDGDTLHLEGAAGTTYYFAVTALPSRGAGGYEIVTAFTLDPEANSGPDANLDGARPLSLTDGARGSVDYSRGDRTDWWRLIAPGPGSLTVDLNGRRATADLQLELYDRHATLLAASRTAGSSREEVSIVLKERGTLFLKVYAESKRDAGAYQLTPWYEMAPDAASGRDGTPAGATALVVGKPARGSVNYNEGDRTDWWKVRAPLPGALAVELEEEAFPANLNMNIYGDPDKAAIAAAQAPRSGRERVSVEIETEGWYYVQVFANEPGDAGRYTLTAAFRAHPNE